MVHTFDLYTKSIVMETQVLSLSSNYPESVNNGKQVKGINLLAFTKLYDSQSIKSRVQEIVGDNFRVQIQKTLLNNAFDIKIELKEKIKTKAIINKTYKYILTKLIEAGIRFNSAKNLY